MHIKRIVFVNRAPFGNLDLSFDGVGVISLTGFNGSGKTTILSYIVDALYEIAKKTYSQEFAGDKDGKLYRISSNLNISVGKSQSLVYICIALNEKDIHYFDFQGDINEGSFQELMSYIGEVSTEIIKFDNIKEQVKQGSFAKYTSASREDGLAIFDNNIAAYFPSYRYEQPGYLNDVYKMQLKYKVESDFNGYLTNPIEITSELPEIANWLMDVILDREIYSSNSDLIQLHNQLNYLISEILKLKVDIPCRFGIGQRHLGGARIQVVDKSTGERIYPTIFNMSAGESALLCLFGELVKHADKIGKNSSDAKGIVLVDEIDKHLHISMQKDILPALIQMFPNVQFIISTHSPFVNIGIEEAYGDKCRIYDLNCGGIECQADDNGIFNEAYMTMVSENERYARRYEELKKTLALDTRPLIITEGKTDWKHLKTAKERLGINDLDIAFYEYADTIGDTILLRMLKDYSRISHGRIIIGIFDRDNFSELKDERLKKEKYVTLGNDVFAFAIAPVHYDIYGTEEISIEHYYRKEDLTKEDIHHRRLFLGEEFYDSSLSKDRKFLCRSGVQKKVKVNGVIDEKVYNINDDPETKESVALSKNAFADLVAEGEFSKEFDFSSFEEIFQVIREICSIGEAKDIRNEQMASRRD